MEIIAFEGKGGTPVSPKPEPKSEHEFVAKDVIVVATGSFIPPKDKPKSS